VCVCIRVHLYKLIFIHKCVCFKMRVCVCFQLHGCCGCGWAVNMVVQRTEVGEGAVIARMVLNSAFPRGSMRARARVATIKPILAFPSSLLIWFSFALSLFCSHDPFDPSLPQPHTACRPVPLNARPRYYCTWQPSGKGQFSLTWLLQREFDREERGEGCGRQK
jgi:hypothetical protein